MTEDLANGKDRAVWSVLNPNGLPQHKEITREEFERLYLCQWVGGSQKVQGLVLNDRPFNHIFT